MCPGATLCANTAIRAALLVAAAAATLPAQEPAGTRLDWRRFGNLSIAGAASAGLASGPVSRVWYSSAGDGLSLITADGQVWETKDFESWTPAAGEAPAKFASGASALPEAGYSGIMDVTSQGGTGWMIDTMADMM